MFIPTASSDCAEPSSLSLPLPPFFFFLFPPLPAPLVLRFLSAACMIAAAIARLSWRATPYTLNCEMEEGDKEGDKARRGGTGEGEDEEEKEEEGMEGGG